MSGRRRRASDPPGPLRRSARIIDRLNRENAAQEQDQGDAIVAPPQRPRLAPARRRAGILDHPFRPLGPTEGNRVMIPRPNRQERLAHPGGRRVGLRQHALGLHQVDGPMDQFERVLHHAMADTSDSESDTDFQDPILRGGNRERVEDVFPANMPIFGERRNRNRNRIESSDSSSSEDEVVGLQGDNVEDSSDDEGYIPEPMDVDDPNRPDPEPELVEMRIHMPPQNHRHFDLFEHIRDMGRMFRLPRRLVPPPPRPNTQRVACRDFFNNRKRKRLATKKKKKPFDIRNPPLGNPNAPGINNLPEHLLTDIFQCLDIPTRIRCERVCTRWRYVGKEKSWQDVRSLTYRNFLKTNGNRLVDNCSGYINAWRPKIRAFEVTQVLQRCGRYLNSLQLDAFRDNLNYSVCSSIGDLTGARLTNLNLNGVPLTNTSLNRLGRNCGNLRTVCFAFCFRDSVPERGLSGFLSKVPHLEEIDLSENERLTGDPSFENMPSSLRKIVLNTCYKLSATGLQFLRNRCNGLRHLEINSVDQLTGPQLTNIFKCWDSLEVIRYSEVPPVNGFINTGVWEFSGMNGLQELQINDSCFATDATMLTVCQQCPNLTKLSINRSVTNLTTTSLSDLSKLRKLTSLDIQRTDHLNDAHLGAIAGNKKLKRLNVQGCHDISNEGILSLLGHCQELEFLQITDCHLVNNGILAKVTEYADKRGKDVTMAATRLELNILRTSITDSSSIQNHPQLKVRHNGVMDRYSLHMDDEHIFDMHWIRL